MISMLPSALFSQAADGHPIRDELDWMNQRCPARFPADRILYLLLPAIAAVCTVEK